MIIGVTGGVGCGKSVVMDLLNKEFGVHIILADNVGHEVMAPDGEAYGEIIDFFGKEILSADGAIDRKILGARVFNDREALDKLNSIIHPAVKRRILGKIENIRNNSDKEPFIAIEAALLLEDNYDEICDTIWYIYATKKERIRRLKESRGYTDEKIASIMKNQLTEKEFRRRSDEVIDNSGNIAKTRKNLQKILDKYKGL